MQLITKSIVKNRFHYIKNILLSQVVIADTTPKTSCTFNGQDSSVVVQSLKAVEDRVPTGPSVLAEWLSGGSTGEFFCLVPFFLP
jgi:hypothetical protein